MRYSVEITEATFTAILEQARYIAVTCRAPLNASRWLEQIWDIVDGLEHLPRRYALAAEDEFMPYEVRRAVAGHYLILFTVDDKARKVWVIGFRHGARLPRPRDLPGKPPSD